jgi:hypothetical protein
MIARTEANILARCSLVTISFDAKRAHGFKYLVVCAHGHIEQDQPAAAAATAAAATTGATSSPFSPSGVGSIRVVVGMVRLQAIKEGEEDDEQR